MAKPTRYSAKTLREFFKKGEWLPISLSGVWDKNATEVPTREAVVDDRIRVTWAQAKVWIDRLALAFLEIGFKKDDVMVIQLPNCSELPLLRVACEKAGILCLPVLRNLRHRDMENILGRVNARGIVIPWKFRDVDYFAMVSDIRPRLKALQSVIVWADTAPPGTVALNTLLNQPLEKKYPADYLKKFTYAPDEVSLINHTTGTTGFPKFVEYPMGARLRLGRGFIESLKLSEKDVVGALGSVPAGANCVPYFGAPQAKSSVVMLEHFEPEAAFKIIEKERVTVACGVPAMWTMMVRHPRRKDYNLSSMRLWWNAGAFLPPQLGAEVEEKLGATILSGLGGVDFGITIMPELDDQPDIRFNTVGKPKAGGRIKLVDDSGKEVNASKVGEVWGIGPSCPSGYYLDPEGTAQAWTKDGWFKTGDLGRFDENGNLLIVGRQKDIIIRGGQNIYPAEIESLLQAHPKIADIAVVAMPDAVMGEKACVYVVPKEGQSLTLKEIAAYLTDQDIALYKIPERLELIDKLPMVGGESKVDKKALQQDIAAKLKSEGKS